jgi:hypothetical protein
MIGAWGYLIHGWRQEVKLAKQAEIETALLYKILRRDESI